MEIVAVNEELRPAYKITDSSPSSPIEEGQVSCDVCRRHLVAAKVKSNNIQPTILHARNGRGVMPKKLDPGKSLSDAS